MDFQLTDAQKALVERADRVGREYFAPKAAHWDRTREYPHENIPILLEHGFLGMTIDKAFGGPGHSLLDAILVMEQLAKYCTTTARIVVETNVGSVGAIMAFGQPHHQTLLAKRILEEGDKPAICMTEREAGTDLASLTTTAREENGEYVINGHKFWITGGGVSKTYLVFARIIDADGTDRGIGAIMVDLGTPGFRVGKRENTMGIRGMPECELHFENCRVPKENLVIAEHGKEAFKKLMMAYNAQRIGASTIALGIAQGAHELALNYLKERRAFGQALADFQGLRWMMAENEIKLQAARALIYQAARNAQTFPNNVQLPKRAEASIAKTYASRIAFEVTSDALQMFGARGYGDDYPLERMLRDVRMFQIGGGTVQAQLNVIANELFRR